MPTIQQIELFKKRAAAKGYNPAKIDIAIGKGLQTQAKQTIQPRQPAPVVPVAPRVQTPVAQPTQQKGFLRKAAEAITKPATDFARFGGEAVAQGVRAVADPDFRKATFNPGSMTDEDYIKLADKQKTFFVKPEEIKDRKTILKTGAKRTAGASAYAVPGGKGVAGAVKAGATAGGLSAFSQDNASLEDVATGALTGGAIGGGLSLVGKALRSEASKKVGAFLKDRGENIQLSTYTKNLGKPIKAEGGKDLLVRMRKVGIKAGDPDSIVEQTNRILQDDGNIVFNATRELSEAGEQIEVSKIVDGLKKQIAQAKSTVTKKPLQEVLEIIETDLAGKTSISPEELYLLKTEYGGLGRWTSLSSAVEKKQAEAWRDVYISANDAIDEALKKGGFEDFRKLNERIHTAMQASQYAARSGNVAPNKYNVGLYDYLAGLGVGVATGNPAMAVGGTVLKQVAESPQASSVIGRIAERAGKIVGGIKPINANVPQSAINTGIVGATQLASPLVSNESNDENGNQPSDSVPQIDLQDNTLEQSVGDIIPQEDIPTESHPIFGDLSRQDVLLQAFQSGLNQNQMNEIGALYDQFAPAREGVATEEQQKAASGLRTEYLSQTKQNGFLDVVNAYRKVSSASDTAAGDVSLIFAYMKMLDPGSTVREGEFATAEQTAGIPDRIVNLYNKAAKGNRIGPKQREEFKSAAKDVYDQSSEQQKQIDDIYLDLARRYGVDPSLLGIGAIGIKE